MEADEDFPRLTPENHRVTSPAMIDYNCIAWAAADTESWWEPGVYWPIESPPDEYGIGILEAAFKSLGFEACDGAESDPGFEKVAIYGNNLFYTHAARQLPTGKWTSKLGKLEDIEHETPDVVAGGVYGEVVGISCDSRQGASELKTTPQTRAASRSSSSRGSVFSVFR